MSNGDDERSRSREQINKKYQKAVEKGQIHFITFHPSYSYEEFVEGITFDVGSGEGNEQRYVIKEGIFKEVCSRALYFALKNNGVDVSEFENKDFSKQGTWKRLFDIYKENQNYVDWSEAERVVMIIDEINRGDIAKIFGELITLIEEDKRLGSKNEIIVKLPYSRDEFGVPPNVYILGTMNTADSSIAHIDIALRRRFVFEEMMPKHKIEEFNDEETFKDEKTKDFFKETSGPFLEKLNEKIRKDEELGRDKQIGHAYFMNVKSENDFKEVLENKIIPLLMEYTWDNVEKVHELLREASNSSVINEALENKFKDEYNEEGQDNE